MSSHNIRFCEEIRKIFTRHPSYTVGLKKTSYQELCLSQLKFDLYVCVVV